MPDFIFEIGTEEMPARFVPALSSELADLLTRGLAEARIDCGKIRSFGTPRRIVVQAEDMAAIQRREEVVVTGPPARIAFDESGALTKAGQGFARSQGVSESDIYRLETDKGEYLAVTKVEGGNEALAVLPALLEGAVRGLPFPKKMRWGSGHFAFGRPIRWILALLGDEIVPFEVAGHASADLTHGHRVMGSGPFTVPGAEAYFDVVRDQGHVIVDPSERERIIREGGDALAAEASATVIWKDSLLNEVVNLVESPKPLLADFDPGFLELPEEVLLTSMESHQKSFGLRGKDGRLVPHFLTAINLDPKDEALVKKGWERVLKARLEDARFFWNTDLASDFETWSAKLESVVFLGPLGSMGDKSRRIERLCGYLAKSLAPNRTVEYSRAGRLAKCDLVTELVGEFADLQGLMGGVYARKKGLSVEVADAIAEHYLPAGPESPVPPTLGGAVVALADKMDTLAGCFGLDMAPTGTADPYALRRAALGICRILLEKSLSLDLGAFLREALAGYEKVELKRSTEEIETSLRTFFAQRIKAYFTGQGRPTLLVEACLGAGMDDIPSFGRRLKALEDFSASEGFEQAVLTFKRAANIIRKQGAEAGVQLSGTFRDDLLKDEAEKRLGAKLRDIAPRFEKLWDAGDYAALMGLLAELRPFVDEFFDNVMVMCEDDALRRNRLNLLGGLVAMLGRLADFNALQV